MGARAAKVPSDPWRTPEERGLLLRTVLWLAHRLRGPLAALGVDYPRFRELLRMRVVLSQRTGGESAKTWGQVGAILAICMTWFTGFLTGVIALATRNAALWVIASQSLAMFLLTLLLFQVLVGVLIDPTDIGVVSAHPVKDRTVFAVRLAEISAYVLILVCVFTAGNVLLPLFTLPPLAVLCVAPVLSLLGGAVTLGLVTLLFAVCLRVVGPTHFQRVALWLQIVGGVGIFLAPHLVRLVPREQWGLWLEQYEFLRLCAPPLLYADLFDYAAGVRASVPLREVLAAFVVPLGLLGLTLLLASRYFVAGLQGTLGAPVRNTGWDRGLFARVGGLLRNREERAGFEFAQALARREPLVLRTILPQLAIFQAMAIGSGLRLGREIELYVPVSAGFLFMVLPNVLLSTQGSSTADARVLFTAAPLASEDAFLRGGIKGLLLQWIGVPAALVFVLQLWIGGPGSLPRSVLAFELCFAAVLAYTRWFHLGMPFTRAIRVGETNASNFGLILMTSLALAILIPLHLALCLHPLALGSGMVSLGVLLVFLWRRLEGLRVSRDKRLLEPSTRLVLE